VTTRTPLPADPFRAPELSNEEHRQARLMYPYRAEHPDGRWYTYVAPPPQDLGWPTQGAAMTRVSAFRRNGVIQDHYEIVCLAGFTLKRQDGGRAVA
jgi:hypothetical protein